MFYDDEIELESEESGRGITDILDEGYGYLDGFVAWCTNELKLDQTTIRQDYLNAECFIDYIANNHRKAVQHVNEFELRWFVFSHYIRIELTDATTEERLLSSLQRFFNYLISQDVVAERDWVQGVLDDTTYYLARRSAYRSLNADDERAWKAGFENWCVELDEDLDTRCLLLPRQLGDGVLWSDAMGWREATLRYEANDRWQAERDVLISQGTGYEDIRGQLLIEFLEWVDTPQPRLDDQTPADVILAERLESPEVEADEDDEEQLQ